MATALANPAYASTVRCPTCHAEFDTANASSHICASTSATGSDQSVSSSLLSFPAPPRSMSMSRNTHLPGKLPKFAPPTLIDPFAANEAFLSPAQLSAEIRAASPFSNPARTGSAASGPFRMPPRSATTPHFRGRSPSPELRMPQDGAFPIFPTKKARENQAKKDRQRSQSTSRGQSTDRARHQRNETTSTSTTRSASPAVPQSPYSRGQFAPRKSSVFSQHSRVEPEEPVPPLPLPLSLHGDGGLLASPQPEWHPSLPAELPVTSPLAGPPVSAGDGEDHLHLQWQTSQPATHSRKTSLSATMKPLDAIGSTRKPSSDLGLSMPRSQSASSHRTETRVERAPSVLEPQSAVIEHRPSPWHSESALAESPLLPQGPLASMEEQVEAEEAAEEAEESERDVLGSLPSIKPVENMHEAASNRARESASSDGSSYSVAHSSSSRSSPPTSASSFSLQHDLPRGENIDSVLNSIAEGTKPPSDADSYPAQTSAAVPLQQRRRGPAKSFSRPNYTPPQLELPKVANGAAIRPSPRSSPQKPEPPREEMQRQNSRSPRSTPEQMSPGSSTRSPVDSLRSPPSTSPMSPRIPHMPRPVRPGDPYANIPSSPAGSLRRPTTPGFKGNCRGCGELIVGKSVSSADGRLTGRYHKHCFVCRTCKEPFQTADFYVIDNHPYCQRHYHTLNQSLCTVCDRGIEGPYMETDALKKFHPHCFTCKECHLILRQDYFEVNGTIYCEKHSKKTDLLGVGGRRNPERRTTRLMMM